MSLAKLFDKMHADREARTRRERHGVGELTFLDNAPTRASNCLLPDGTLTNAESLIWDLGGRQEARRVWTRRLPNSVLRRRGRLKIDQGKALLFIDEPDADLDVSPANGAPDAPDLERDLVRSARVRALVRSSLFATLLYSALCNTRSRHRTGRIARLAARTGNTLTWHLALGH